MLAGVNVTIQIVRQRCLLRRSVGPRGVLVDTSNTVGLVSFNSTDSSVLGSDAEPPGNSLRCTTPRCCDSTPGKIRSSLFSVTIVNCRLLANAHPFDSRTLVGTARAGRALVLPARHLHGCHMPTTDRRTLLHTLRPGARTHCRTVNRFLRSFGPSGTDGADRPRPLVIHHPLLM